MDNISEDKEEEETSDEEEVAEPAPIRRRLRCKTSAPEYGPPSRKVQLRLEEIVGRATPHGLPVMKRPGMLKRPAGRSPWPNECCAGYQGIACRFCPMEPGKPARVHPERGIRHCSFCKKEDMEATSQDAGRRGVLTRALKKFLAVDRGIFDMALQRVQLFLGEEAAKDYQKKAGGKPRPEAGSEEALEHRQLVGRPLTRKQRKSMMRPSVATSVLLGANSSSNRRSSWHVQARSRRTRRRPRWKNCVVLHAAWRPMTATYHVQVNRRQGCWKIIASSVRGECVRNVPACAHALCAPWIFGASTKLRCRGTSAPLADMESTCHSPKMFLRPYGL